jgi:FKBP-type peptidyl-prolyl cis-trans isomerase
VWLAVLLLLALPVLSMAGEQTQTLESQSQKENYSIGYQIGIGMTYDRVAVDYDSFLMGLRAATSGSEPSLSREEMKTLIIDIKKASRDARLKEMQELVVKNAEEAKKFLEQNAGKDGIKTTESGLQYKVLRQGDGPSPTVDDFVRVHYRGLFPDGKEFDSSYAKGEPQIFQTDGVIKGWTEALQLMKVNSKWQLFIPPELAYGRGGLEGKIPPNKVLIFEIEILAIGETGKENQSG